MNNKSPKEYLRSPGLIAIVSLFVAYGLAFAVDSSIHQLRMSAAETFNFKPLIILSAIVPLGVVIGILALAWLVLRHLSPSRFVAGALIISGLTVVGEFLSIFASFPLWLRTTIIGRFRYSLMNFGTQSSLYYLAYGCIMIGFVALWKYREKQKDPYQAS
jgi:hypothetical protein